MANRCNLAAMACFVLGLVAKLSAQTFEVCTDSFHVEPPSYIDAVHQLDSEKAKMTTAPKSADIETALRNAETFHSSWLKDIKGRLQGVSTIRHGAEDVLLARWNSLPNEPQIKSIQMWDGAIYELVILELVPNIARSPDSLRNFLLTAVKPLPDPSRITGPYREEVVNGFGFIRQGPGAQRWRGLLSYRTTPAQSPIFDQQYFTAQEVDGRSFLVFELGKRAAYAPWTQSIFLGDRFPPFAVVVQKWPREKIVREITAPESQACRNARIWGRPNEFLMNRYDVLVAEMVRRGMNDKEFQAIMDGPGGRGLLIQKLGIAGETERYAPSILETIRRYENLPDVDIRIMPKTKANIVWSHLAEVIRALQWQRSADFSEPMLELAAEGHEADLALDYVQERIFDGTAKFDNSRCQELAKKLATATVPAGSEQKRDFVVKWIRAKHDN